MAQNAAVNKLKVQVMSNREKAKPIEVLINQSVSELGKALPATMNPERLARIALTTLRLCPALSDCTPSSFLGALFQAAQLGLEPNIEGQCYLIPYTNSKYINGQWNKVKEVQFQIGYKGYIELFYRHEKAACVDMQTVYENDKFDFCYGTDSYIKHCPALRNRGEVVAYYAVAKLANGASLFKVMSKEECIQHGKTHSKCFNDKSSPWQKDPDAMCKKTVLIQLMKMLPKSVELQKALAMDNTTKSSVRADMFEVKDETNWQDDNTELPPVSGGE